MKEIFQLPLVVALAAQISAQLFKVVFYSLRERRFAPERFTNAAGIPSAHTAFVVALTGAIALRNGITADIFAVSFVFSAIVIYDSFRLRGHVQRHAETLNQLLRPRGDDQFRPLSEHVGHSVGEVVAGILWGLLWTGVGAL